MLNKLIILVLLISAIYYWYQQKGVAINLEDIPKLDIVYDDKLSIKNHPYRKNWITLYNPSRRAAIQ